MPIFCCHMDMAVRTVRIFFIISAGRDAGGHFHDLTNHMLFDRQADHIL